MKTEDVSDPDHDAKHENSHGEWDSHSLNVISNAIYSDESQSCFRDYYNCLEELLILFHTDPHFSHFITGTGFDGLPPLLSFMNLNVDQTDIINPQRETTVFYVHRHSIALQDNSVQWKPKTALLFYITEGTTPTTVKLWMSAQVKSNMVREYCGLKFNENSTYIEKEEKGTLRFHLDAKSFEESFRSECPPFIVHQGQLFSKLFGNEPDQDNFNVQELILSEKKKFQVQSCNQIPAIYSPEWPSSAFSWFARKRQSGWPSASVKSLVIDNGCHLVPKQDENSCFWEWELVFSKAEKSLVAAMDTVQKRAVVFVSALLSTSQVLGELFTREMILACSFWLFEDNQLDEEQSDNIPSYHKLAKCILKRMLFYLDSGNLPHYFIPEQNMLALLPSQINLTAKQSLLMILENPLNSMISCEHLPIFLNGNSQPKPELYSRLIQQVNMQLPSYLWSEFNINIELSILAFFSRLHRKRILESIILHRWLLRMLSSKENDSNPSTLIFTKIVKNSLASLYEAKGITSQTDVEQSYYRKKAGEMYNLTKDMDNTLGRTRLAMHLIKQKKYHVAMAELTQALSMFSREPMTYEQLISGIGNECSFSDKLWHKFNSGGMSVDIIFTRLLRTLCPTYMNKSLAMTICPLLGSSKKSVAFYHPDFLLNVHLAMCYNSLRSEGMAKTILQQLVLQVPQVNLKDQNEKRIAAQYIILGNCYLEMNFKKEAMSMYGQASKSYPGPTNPARFMKAFIQYEETFDKMRQGLFIMGLATVLSVTFNYIEAQI